MTKDEFKKALWAYGQERHCLGGEMSFEQRGIAVKSAGAIRKALLDTYDEMTECIAELEAMLKRAEWGERTLDGRVIFCGCPVCLAAPYTHAPDCALAAMLRGER